MRTVQAKCRHCALSEMRFPDEGSLQEHGARYTLFWSEKLSTERRLAGVGFMVRTSITSKLENLPTGHSDHIMSMRLPLKNKQYATLFSVYAPTLQAEFAEKDKFYSELRNLIQSTPADDKVIILGDFNARVGEDATAWKGVLGRHGVGNCNDNGRWLLELCTEQQLVITNTIFHQKDSLKTTWMHPRSRHWHLIDYVIVRHRDLKDVLHTGVMPSTEYHTDHCLVRCKLNLNFKPKQRKGGPPKKSFKLSKLQSAEVKTDFQADLQTKLGHDSCPKDSSPEALWIKLKTAILQTSKKVMGLSTKKNKDWFDENNHEILDLLAKKRSAHQAHLTQLSCPMKKAAFGHTCGNLQLNSMSACKRRKYSTSLHFGKNTALLTSLLVRLSLRQFTYLGCTITSDAKIDKEVDNRLAKASCAFGRLYKRVWNNKHLKKNTKISVCRAVVLTTLLYGSESWVTYRLHLLECFHQRCLRIILNIHWSDYITNVEVLQQVVIASIEAMLLKAQLRWSGHVSRMEDHRLPKITLYGELYSSHCDRGAPKKRYKDSLRKSLGVCQIDCSRC